MKIIYIHQYFRTPEQGGAVRSYHLAKGLVEAGHEVEMISAHNSGFYDQKWIEGVKVHYLPVAYSQHFGFLRRIWSFLMFVRKSKKLLQKLSRPDLLYITSTPLTTGLIGLWAKRKLALPYVFEVRDLWPEAPIQVGAIRNRLAIAYLKKLEKKIYSQSLRLIGLSPGIVRHLQSLVSDKEIALIPNFSDLELFYPKEPDSTLQKSLGLSPGLTIAYTGALGMVNAVDELLDLAEWAQKRGKNWNFLILGEGSHQETLQQDAKQRQLHQVRFLPLQNKKQVNEILNLADFAWISFAHYPVLKTNSPNKFFDALAAGKPILVNHKGWVFDLVKSHDLGIAFLPGKWEKAWEKLEELESQPMRIHAMGQRSRQLASFYFSKELAVSRVLEVVESRPKLTLDSSADIRIA